VDDVHAETARLRALGATSPRNPRRWGP
jgi:hypothetical protein